MPVKEGPTTASIPDIFVYPNCLPRLIRLSLSDDLIINLKTRLNRYNGVQCNLLKYPSKVTVDPFRPQSSRSFFKKCSSVPPFLCSVTFTSFGSPSLYNISTC